ncbi:pheromone processing endoprotease [Rhizina undulata]
MRFASASLWLTILRLSAYNFVDAKNAALRPRDYELREYYALHLTPGVPPEDIGRLFGLEHEGVIGELDDHHLYSAPIGRSDVVADHLEDFGRRKRRKRDLKAEDLTERDLFESVLYAEKQKLKRLVKRSIPPNPRSTPAPAAQDVSSQPVDSAEATLLKLAETLGIQDPIFQDQWHLYNMHERGHDINVTGVWLEGITGVNSTVAIVDDGLDMDSLDLKANYFAAGSYDFNDQAPDPKPRLSDDRHGTRCAGEVAAVKNDVCGVGVAWDSKVAGIRILSKQISDADEAIAMNYAYQDNLIYSCSWGPPDDGKSMDAPGILIKRAMVKGVQQGRGGLGSVYVFASGNGAANDDNCNFDGYTNSIYSITIGAIDRKGMHPYYSEECSAQMVVTYSSGSGDAIHTTDVGTNACYSAHGGTSAAAPLAAGIFSLVLSIRPDLSWRDLQYLSLDTAVPVNEDDPDWETTAIGKKFNHKYGYGKLDAWAIVQAAKTFESVKPQAWFNSPILKVNAPIPEGTKGLKSQIQVTKEDISSANVERLEHVTVTMNLKHGQRGDVSVDLISPKGVTSRIATARKYDKSTAGYGDWTFMSVKHWGEDGVGTWTIIVKDTVENQKNGSLIDWRLTLWGEAIDADKAELLPLPGDSTNDTEGGIAHPTSTVEAETTVLPEPTSTGEPKVTENPTDHITRPVNSKPTDGPESATSTATSGSATPTGAIADEDKAAADETTSSYLPSFLPTFGVSAKTQVWIYGAIVGITLFVGALAAYFFVQRKKQRASRNGMDYEFEVLNADDDVEGGAAGGNQARGAVAGGRRKAKDLYDAFGASDDEEELFSDDDEKSYDHARDYDDDEARGIDEGPRTGDREKLLGGRR